MDLQALLREFQNCPCGETHEVDIEDVVIEHGVKDRVGDIIAAHTAARRVFLVADENTMKASRGILPSLSARGFQVKTLLFQNLRVADMEDVDRIVKEAAAEELILSVGSGSLNDICRLAAFRLGKPFVLFATAPSMDGLASDTAPITCRNFKKSYQARQPFLILADTEILAKAPAVLKGAGFGDMMAKYVGLVDWHISHLLTGEKICPRVEHLTKTATERIRALAPRITGEDEESAKAVAEALILTGIAMKFAHSSRPASGAEHVVSHFWEIKKLEKGELSDFHGRKVGVATLLLSRVYHGLAARESIETAPDSTDWEAVRKAYGEGLYPSIRPFNEPTTVLEGVTPRALRENWGEIRRIIHRFLPTPDVMERLLKEAGAATTLEEIGVSPALGRLGLLYHPFMRRRMMLTRLFPMLPTVMAEEIFRYAGI